MLVYALASTRVRGLTSPPADSVLTRRQVIHIGSRRATTSVIFANCSHKFYTGQCSWCGAFNARPRARLAARFPKSMPRLRHLLASFQKRNIMRCGSRYRSCCRLANHKTCMCEIIIFYHCDVNTVISPARIKYTKS